MKCSQNKSKIFFNHSEHYEVFNNIYWDLFHVKSFSEKFARLLYGTNLKYFKHSELCKVLNTILLETFRVNYFSAQSEMFQTNKKCSGTLRNVPKQSPECFRTFSNVLMFQYNSEMFFQSYLKCFETI